MLSRHGPKFTQRFLKRGSCRALNTTPAFFSPRTRPRHSKDSEPKTEPVIYELPKEDVKNDKPAARPRLSLLEQQARLEKALVRRLAHAKGAAGAGTKASIQGSKEHNDLAGFLAFAERGKLSRESTVYKGTHYEYTVLESLKQFGFHLQRTGKSNDKGIDLLGHWRLPGKPYEIKVLVQCKVSRGTPSAIRELEGAYIGAPNEWQGDNVLTLLATSKPLTPGVLEGIQRSPSAIGALFIAPDGLVQQFVWNSVAGERGLAGVGVTAKYTQAQSRASDAPEGATKTIKTVALTWKGQPFIARLNAS